MGRFFQMFRSFWIPLILQGHGSHDFTQPVLTRGCHVLDLTTVLSHLPPGGAQDVTGQVGLASGVHSGVQSSKTLETRYTK